NGMKVSNPAYDQIKPKLVSNGEASAIAVWQDGRSGTNFDIYASRLPVFGAPVCAIPADSATQVSIQPLLKWLSVAGAGDYYFQLAADSLFFSIVREGTANDTLAQITATLNNARTYYWRVKGIGGEYSARSSFTTVTPVIPILNFPVLNATVYTLTPELHWNITVAPAGIKFDVYLSTDSLFASGYTTTLYADSAMQITLATLLPTTHYYWKVRSKTASGEILSYSERADFTTFGTLVVPNPSWPTGGATVYSNNPTLYWYMSAPAYTYTFQVRYKPTASGVWSAPVSAGSDMNVQIHGLTAGTSYDWQVQSFNGTSYSDWSATHSFVTYNSAPGTPPQPMLSYPTGGVTSYTFSPILYWYISASSAGMDFTVNLSKNSDFSAPVQIFTSVTNLYQQLNNLDPGTMYYWRVQSYNGSSYSSWSAVDSFYTFNLSGNLTPVLTYPLGGTTVYSATPALYWYTLGGGAGTQYEIQYALDTPSFTGSIYSAVPSCTLPTLEYGGKYYWRVRAAQGATTSSWSGVDSFEVTGKAGSLTPILTWPVGGALSSNSPKLYWYVNSAVPGMSFSVEYADNEAFTSPVTVVTTDYFTTLSGLSAGVTYSWRVRTWNGSHFSPYSSPAMFVTTAGTEPARPMCGSPVNGVVIGTNAPMLSWFHPVASGSLTYELQYAATPDFTNPVTIPAISNNRYTTGSLAYSMPVFWRVRSKTAAGVYSAYSEPERFVPVRPTAISDGGNNPFDFVLTQNYPNPFNPGTIISYQVPGNKSPQAALQQVTLTIYDILGREVTTLINTMQQPGEYRVYFNASSLPSGVYIYKLQAGTMRQVKKMVLQK
ncbi:MAG: T9SS type A sorting domain-containing protein, partial [Ignavibacteriales bacterium]|nr:T9SS type A sorting domain-containing protein [Ignavibacteriales bacterium]